MHILSNMLLKFLIVVHALIECKFGDTSWSVYRFTYNLQVCCAKYKLCKNSILEISFKYTSAWSYCTDLMCFLSLVWQIINSVLKGATELPSNLCVTTSTVLFRLLYPLTVKLTFTCSARFSSNCCFTLVDLKRETECRRWQLMLILASLCNNIEMQYILVLRNELRSDTLKAFEIQQF